MWQKVVGAKPHSGLEIQRGKLFQNAGNSPFFAKKVGVQQLPTILLNNHFYRLNQLLLNNWFGGR
jgi:hypothetical protein